MLTVPATPTPSQNQAARIRRASRSARRRENVGSLSARIAICIALLATVLLAPTGPAAANDSVSQTVTLHASVASLIVVDDPGSSAACRLLYPGGTGGGNRSTYCVMTKPFTIRVRSNEPWTGAFALTDCTTNKGSLAVTSDALRASTVPVTTYDRAADPAQTTILKPGTLITETSHAAGEFTYTRYLALRLNNGDKAEKFCATLSYSATQDSNASTTLGTIIIRFTPTP
jgi:hypothetical protein